VTYRLTLDETSRRAPEPSADRRANQSAPKELGRKEAPPAGVVEEPGARMQAPTASPQHLDELAKTEPAPAVQSPPQSAPAASAGPQAGADAGMAGGADVPASPSAEKKDASQLAAKPSADASSAPAAARAKAAAPGEASSSTGVTAEHGVIVVTSAANQLLEWRFSGTGIERSDDGGRTWQPQSPTPAAILAASAPIGQVCWAVGQVGTVIRTVDGRNWQVLKAPTTADLVEASASNESSVTVKSSDGNRFSTTDGGLTWSRR
jgi:hypothetical protein